MSEQFLIVLEIIFWILYFQNEIFVFPLAGVVFLSSFLVIREKKKKHEFDRQVARYIVSIVVCIFLILNYFFDFF